jgi:hypothetical protein
MIRGGTRERERERETEEVGAGEDGRPGKDSRMEVIAQRSQAATRQRHDDGHGGQAR